MILIKRRAKRKFIHYSDYLKTTLTSCKWFSVLSEGNHPTICTNINMTQGWCRFSLRSDQLGDGEGCENTMTSGTWICKKQEGSPVHHNSAAGTSSEFKTLTPSSLF